MLLSGVLFVLFLAGCWLYCLTDAVLTPKWEYRSRLAKSTWIYLIAATFIVGAAAWLIARRTWRNRYWVSAPAGREARAGRGAGDFTWHPASAADTAAARHPASRSRQAPPGHGALPKGPDDDPEFMRQLDRRIRGTSTDPGELSARPTGHPAARRPLVHLVTLLCAGRGPGRRAHSGRRPSMHHFWSFFGRLKRFKRAKSDAKMSGLVGKSPERAMRLAGWPEGGMRLAGWPEGGMRLAGWRLRRARRAAVTAGRPRRRPAGSASR